jgi:hypothetical protein
MNARGRKGSQTVWTLEVSRTEPTRTKSQQANQLPSPRLVLDLDTPPCFRYAWPRRLSSQVGCWARFPLSSRHRDDDQREDGEEAAGEEDATVPEGSF